MHHVFEPREMRRGGVGKDGARKELSQKKKEKKYHGSSAVLIAQKYN